jgi:hypothetical protein
MEKGFHVAGTADTATLTFIVKCQREKKEERGDIENVWRIIFRILEQA